MKRILIVDDLLTERELIKAMFESQPFETDLASNGIEAYAMQQKKQYDLVVTDVAMPKMAGSELIVKLKKEYPYIKIVVISGADPANLEAAFKMGADIKLEKPFTREALLNAIHVLLSDYTLNYW